MKSDQVAALSSCSGHAYKSHILHRNLLYSVTVDADRNQCSVFTVVLHYIQGSSCDLTRGCAKPEEGDVHRDA